MHLPLPRSHRAGCLPLCCVHLAPSSCRQSSRARLGHGSLLVLPHPSSPRLYEPFDCPVPREVLRGTAPCQGWQGSLSQRYASARGSGI